MRKTSLRKLLKKILEIADLSEQEQEEYVAKFQKLLQEEVAVELLKKFSLEDAVIFQEFFEKHKNDEKLIEEFFKNLSTKEEFIEIVNQKSDELALKFIERFLLSCDQEQKNELLLELDRLSKTTIPA